MTPVFALGGVIPSVVSLLIPIMAAAPTQAQTLPPELREEFLSDPLDDQPRDPLLPSPAIDRPLSPLELYTLEQALDQLALDAEALVQGRPRPTTDVEPDSSGVNDAAPRRDRPTLDQGFVIEIPTGEETGMESSTDAEAWMGNHPREPLGDHEPFDANPPRQEDGDQVERLEIGLGLDLTESSEGDPTATDAEDFMIDQTWDEVSPSGTLTDPAMDSDTDISEDLDDLEDPDLEDPEIEESDTDKALALWMREVRLRRVLGLDPELAAIDRVAQWIRDLSATQELQLLSARLAVIQADLDITEAQDRQRLDNMATTYTTLGNVSAAAELRRALANQALDQGQRAEHQAQLEALASLYADWFYFPEAAATYAELVQIAQANIHPEDEIQFLNRQIDNLEAAQQFEAALAAQQQLLQRLSTTEALWPLMAELQYRMAQNYRQVGDLDLASRQYQIAYTNAISIQQLAVAADALRGLSSLYRDLDRWPDVDYLYQQLLVVERTALNAYGLMDTFDQMGQLYELTENPEGALLAYREGLILANQLRHRQEHFESQINRLTQGSETAS